MKKKKKIVSKIITVVCALVVLTGLIFVLLEPISNFMYNNEQNQLIDEYEKTFYPTSDNDSGGIKSNNHSSKQNKNYISNANHTVIDFDRLRKDVKRYNKKIYDEKQASLGAKGSYAQAVLNLTDYGIQNNIYGYLQIPKINLNMAIYLGASDYNMSLGATQLGGTSLPYGGKNTNTVIAGHCGYGYCDYFRHLENLSKGDTLTMVTPFKKIKYRAIDKKVVAPKTAEPFRIVDGKDLVTLFTCYPYPTNKYRICVTFERI